MDGVPDAPIHAPAGPPAIASFNDVSERHDQVEGTGQWVKGKSCDTFAPLGPALVTPDEVGDPQDLSLVTRVSGEVVQTARTKEMYFSW